MLLDLTKGITETEQYKAFKFPGGEIHVKLTEECKAALSEEDDDESIIIRTRVNNPDEFILFCLFIDMIRKDYTGNIYVQLPYVPYAQADRDFSDGESFSLLTVSKMLGVLPIDILYVFDVHSDVAPALLNMNIPTIVVEDNSEYIRWVLGQLIYFKGSGWNEATDLVILAPDAGAYKKIFKLCDKINFQGQVEVANKYRNTTNGNIDVRLSLEDFAGKDVLIIDDICVGGRTFVELARLLKTRNTGELHLAISHGIFSNGFAELETYFNHIFTTNSRKDSYESDSIMVYDVFTENE